VGLGFGLQEIFANFVSGIIILFERPVRVGDVVTLGETTGVISRIRMRATTIVDWDRKEYIVPNKDLVTQRLLNWTLSDHTNRIVVNLGVAYGSDTGRACGLLLEAAREQPHVLKEPPPVAFFDSFGDSALNLKLLCFLPNLENRWQTIHNLNSTIDRKFKEAGLEIPFPQRDLNVKFDAAGVAVELEGKKVIFGGDAAADRRRAEAKRQGAA
jgi:potassium efflux system protein